ncbi:MAG: hypothetical protein AAF739_07460 [Pseudomonadota bacterium]
MSSVSHSESPSQARQELVSRLSSYLSDLSDDSRQMLVQTIDRARARGEDSPVHAIIMDAVRDVPQPAGNTARPLSAERRFFDPVEPFLIGTPIDEKIPGHVERKSLRSIWIWITRDLAPGRLDGPLASLRATVADDDHDAIKDAAAEFRKAFCQAARQSIRECQQQQGSLARLEAQLGGPNILADMQETVTIFEQDPVISAILNKVPDQIVSGEAALNAIMRAMRVYAKAPEANAFLGFSALLRRFETPSDVVRLAAQIAQSSDPTRIRKSAMKSAIDAAVAAVRVEADHLVHLLSEDRTMARISVALRRFDELTAALSRTLDESPNDPWLRELTEIRVDIGDRIGKELEPLLHMVRSVVGVVEIKGRQIVPDDTSIGDAVFGTSLFVAAREARGSLALNSAIERLERGLQKILENQGEQAIDRLANASETNWDAALARSRAAVFLFKAYFGGEYGATMARRQQTLVENRALPKAG